VLAVPYDQIVPVMACFCRHISYARAALRFRREYGSGVKQGLTLGERMTWAASNHAVKMAMAAWLVNQERKEFEMVKEKVIDADVGSVLCVGECGFTVGNVLTAMVCMFRYGGEKNHFLVKICYIQVQKTATKAFYDGFRNHALFLYGGVFDLQMATKMARDVYIARKHTRHEAKYGIKWQVMDDKLVHLPLPCR
jgi:hypothetical protein